MDQQNDAILVTTKMLTKMDASKYYALLENYAFKIFAEK